ncbi:MAG: 16S rRNA processing protein RimM [Phaeodactylibacter sp.]|nr:16S rRNA processing protein RimM [Phaeodactylibacter sp.]
MEEEYVPIGRAGKAFGTEGALKFRVEEPFLDDFLDAPVIFLELLGNPVPFFIEYIRNESPLIVKLEEVDSRESALELAGKALLLREEDVARESLERPFDLSALEGFLVVDRKAGEVGRIEEVIELPQQMMAIVPYEAREVLIPLNDQLILEVDVEARRISMDLPEGLLEL